MAHKTELKVVMGAMTFGAAGKNEASVHDLKEASGILDIFQKHGHTEVDTSSYYGGGTSEQYLADLHWRDRGLSVHTKICPLEGPNLHTPEALRESLTASLKTLQTDKVEVWYLHIPDRSTPWEVTFKAINELHKEGKFDKLGLSNYKAWEVAEIVMLCRANGWVQPTVYQGGYNAIHRAVEPELVPCLRKLGLSFYAYNPLGGGLLTGKYTGSDMAPKVGSRFDTTKGDLVSQVYWMRYWKDSYFKSLEMISKAVEKEGLTFAEAALRWTMHHSELRKEHGDAVLIGASSVKHIEQNLVDLEKGPLPQSIVQALDEAWNTVKGDVSGYWS